MTGKRLEPLELGKNAPVFEGTFRKNLQALYRLHGKKVTFARLEKTVWAHMVHVKCTDDAGKVVKMKLHIYTELLSAEQGNLACDECRIVGWHYPVGTRRVHVILPSDKVLKDPTSLMCLFELRDRGWMHRARLDASKINKEKDQDSGDGTAEFVAGENIFHSKSHLLHGVLHQNGHGHLCRVNGKEGGSMRFSGTQLMNVWDQLCTVLRARNVSVEDVSNNLTMELRVLHPLAYGTTWYGRWGYGFGRGPFNLSAEDWQAAIETARSVLVADLLPGGSGKARRGPAKVLANVLQRWSPQPEQLSDEMYTVDASSEPGAVVTVGDLMQLLLTCLRNPERARHLLEGKGPGAQKPKAPRDQLPVTTETDLEKKLEEAFYINQGAPQAASPGPEPADAGKQGTGSTGGKGKQSGKAAGDASGRRSKGEAKAASTAPAAARANNGAKAQQASSAADADVMALASALGAVEQPDAAQKAVAARRAKRKRSDADAGGSAGSASRGRGKGGRSGGAGRGGAGRGRASGARDLAAELEAPIADTLTAPDASDADASNRPQKQALVDRGGAPAPKPAIKLKLAKHGTANKHVRKVPANKAEGAGTAAGEGTPAGVHQPASADPAAAHAQSSEAQALAPAPEPEAVPELDPGFVPQQLDQDSLVAVGSALKRLPAAALRVPGLPSYCVRLGALAENVHEARDNQWSSSTIAMPAVLPEYREAAASAMCKALYDTYGCSFLATQAITSFLNASFAALFKPQDVEAFIRIARKSSGIMDATYAILRVNRRNDRLLFLSFMPIAVYDQVTAGVLPPNQGETVDTATSVVELSKRRPVTQKPAEAEPTSLRSSAPASAPRMSAATSDISGVGSDAYRGADRSASGGIIARAALDRAGSAAGLASFGGSASSAHALLAPDAPRFAPPGAIAGSTRPLGPHPGAIQPPGYGGLVRTLSDEERVVFQKVLLDLQQYIADVRPEHRSFVQQHIPKSPEALKDAWENLKAVFRDLQKDGEREAAARRLTHAAKVVRMLFKHMNDAGLVLPAMLGNHSAHEGLPYTPRSATTPRSTAFTRSPRPQAFSSGALDAGTVAAGNVFASSASSQEAGYAHERLPDGWPGLAPPAHPSRDRARGSAGPGYALHAHPCRDSAGGSAGPGCAAPAHVVRDRVARDSASGKVAGPGYAPALPMATVPLPLPVQHASALPSSQSNSHALLRAEEAPAAAAPAQGGAAAPDAAQAGGGGRLRVRVKRENGALPIGPESVIVKDDVKPDASAPVPDVKDGAQVQRVDRNARALEAKAAVTRCGSGGHGTAEAGGDAAREDAAAVQEQTPPNEPTRKSHRPAVRASSRAAAAGPPPKVPAERRPAQRRPSGAAGGASQTQRAAPATAQPDHRAATSPATAQPPVTDAEAILQQVSPQLRAWCARVDRMKPGERIHPDAVAALGPDVLRDQIMADLLCIFFALLRTDVPDSILIHLHYLPNIVAASGVQLNCEPRAANTEAARTLRGAVSRLRGTKHFVKDYDGFNVPPDRTVRTKGAGNKAKKSVNQRASKANTIDVRFEVQVLWEHSVFDFSRAAQQDDAAASDKDRDSAQAADDSDDKDADNIQASPHRLAAPDPESAPLPSTGGRCEEGMAADAEAVASALDAPSPQDPTPRSAPDADALTLAAPVNERDGSEEPVQRSSEGLAATGNGGGDGGAAQHAAESMDVDPAAAEPSDAALVQAGAAEQAAEPLRDIQPASEAPPASQTVAAAMLEARKRSASPSASSPRASKRRKAQDGKARVTFDSEVDAAATAAADAPETVAAAVMVATGAEQKEEDHEEGVLEHRHYADWRSELAAVRSGVGHMPMPSRPPPPELVTVTSNAKVRELKRAIQVAFKDVYQIFDDFRVSWIHCPDVLALSGRGGAAAETATPEAPAAGRSDAESDSAAGLQDTDPEPPTPADGSVGALETYAAAEEMTAADAPTTPVDAAAPALDAASAPADASAHPPNASAASADAPTHAPGPDVMATESASACAAPDAIDAEMQDMDGTRSEPAEGPSTDATDAQAKQDVAEAAAPPSQEGTAAAAASPSDAAAAVPSTDALAEATKCTDAEARGEEHAAGDAAASEIAAADPVVATGAPQAPHTDAEVKAGSPSPSSAPEAENEAVTGDGNWQFGDDDKLCSIFDTASVSNKTIRLYVAGPGIAFTNEALRYAGGMQDWVVNCTCGVLDDDGERMLCCDKCSEWLHAQCMGVPDSAPDPARFVCVRCAPKSRKKSTR